MAWVCRVLSSSVAAESCRRRFPFPLPLPFKFERLFCKSVSSSNPLILRLLQVPKSQIKTTLDSVDIFALSSSQFSWDAFITSLRCSSPEKALLVLEWRLDKMLKGNEVCRDEFSNLISLCGKVQNVAFAMHVFTLMEARGIKPDSFVFNSLIYACLCAGDVVTALSLFEIMASSEEYKPNSGTYDTFILGFSSLGNTAAMDKWYAAKLAAGFSANVRTYESLISGSIKARDYDSTDRYYEEMVSLGVIPSIPILENVLEGLCKCKKIGEVKTFVEFLLDGCWKINENMVQKLVKCYCELREVDEMEELLQTFIKFNQSPEILQEVHCGIIRLYALSDRLDDVEYSVGRMGKQGLSFKCAEDVEKVVCSYFRCEAYDRLGLFLDHIKGSYKLTRSTYDFLIAGYRRAGLSEKLDSVINDMKLAEIV